MSSLSSTTHSPLVNAELHEESVDVSSVIEWDEVL